jgi:hypothetical protein
LLGLKILKFFDADSDPGSGIFLTLDEKNADPIYFISNQFLGSGYGLDLDSVRSLDPDQVRKKNYLQDKVKKFHV